MDLVKLHSENQSKIGSSCREAIKKTRELIHKKNRDKKAEIKEQISKLLNKEKQTVEQLLESEKEMNEEILKVANIQYKPKDPSNENIRTQEIKNQQLNTIWSEAEKELDAVLERQRERLKRSEENFKSAKQSPISTSPQTVNALREQRNSIHDMQTNNVNEFHRKLDLIRKDMDKVCQQMEDNDRKEKENLEKILNKSRIKEIEEKEKLWTKFMSDLKNEN